MLENGLMIALVLERNMGAQGKKCSLTLWILNSTEVVGQDSFLLYISPISLKGLKRSWLF